jgi:hypothetical protein
VYCIYNLLCAEVSRLRRSLSSLLQSWGAAFSFPMDGCFLPPGPSGLGLRFALGSPGGRFFCPTCSGPFALDRGIGGFSLLGILGGALRGNTTGVRTPGCVAAASSSCLLSAKLCFAFVSQALLCLQERLLPPPPACQPSSALPLSAKLCFAFRSACSRRHLTCSILLRCAGAAASVVAASAGCAEPAATVAIAVVEAAR